MLPQQLLPSGGTAQTASPTTTKTKIERAKKKQVMKTTAIEIPFSVSVSEDFKTLLTPAEISIARFGLQGKARASKSEKREEEQEEDDEKEQQQQQEEEEEQEMKEEKEQEEEEEQEEERKAEEDIAPSIPVFRFQPLNQLVTEKTHPGILKKIADQCDIKYQPKATSKTLATQIYRTLLVSGRFYDNPTLVTSVYGHTIADPKAIREERVNYRVVETKKGSFLKKFTAKPAATTTTSTTMTTIKHGDGSLQKTHKSFQKTQQQQQGDDLAVAEEGEHEREGPEDEDEDEADSSNLWFPTRNPAIIGSSTSSTSLIPISATTSENEKAIKQRIEIFNELHKALVIMNPDDQIKGEPDPVLAMGLRPEVGSEETYEEVLERINSIIQLEETGPEAGDMPEFWKSVIRPLQKMSRQQMMSRERSNRLKTFKSMSVDDKLQKLAQLVASATDADLLVMRDLLKHGQFTEFIDLNRPVPDDDKGRTVLMIAIDEWDVKNADSHPIDAVIMLFYYYLSEGEEGGGGEGEDGGFLLRGNKSSESCRDFLDVNVQDQDGKTVLMYLTEKCYKVRTLVSGYINKVEKLDEEQKQTPEYDMELARSVTAEWLKTIHLLELLLISPLRILKYALGKSPKRKPTPATTTTTPSTPATGLVSVRSISKYCSRMNKVHINMKSDGRTAPMMAVENGCEICLMVFQKTGKVDLSFQDNKGMTALHHATRSNKTRLIIPTLQSPTDWSAVDEKGNSVFHVVTRFSWDLASRLYPDAANDDTPLQILWNAFNAFATSVAEYELAKRRATLKQQQQQQSQRTSGRTDEERKLPPLPQLGSTAAEEAVEKEKLRADIVARLINTVNSQGLTPLMQAALRRDEVSTNFLLFTMHADPTVVSPLICVKLNGQGCTIVYMLEHLLYPDLVESKKQARKNILHKLKMMVKRIETLRNIMQEESLRRKVLGDAADGFPPLSKPTTTSIPPEEKFQKQYPALSLVPDVTRLLAQIINAIDSITDSGTQAKLAKFIRQYWSNSDSSCEVFAMSKEQKLRYFGERGRAAEEGGFKEFDLRVIELESNLSEFTQEACEDFVQFLSNAPQVRKLLEEHSVGKELERLAERAEKVVSTTTTTSPTDQEQDEYYDEEDYF